MHELTRVPLVPMIKNPWYVENKWLILILSVFSLIILWIKYVDFDYKCDGEVILTQEVQSRGEPAILIKTKTKDGIVCVEYRREKYRILAVGDNISKK